jgi:diguanylate cyclase (GGDEF)-like protein/PAS domain S-box-containing protein
MQNPENTKAVRTAEQDDAVMFDLAPVSLWLEDFSGVKRLFDEWRAAGVTDLRGFFLEDPARVAACSRRIVVVKVNQKTLSLFEANSLAHLVENLGRIFRDDMLLTHIEELVQIWNGNREFVSQTVNYALSGKRLDIQLKGTILPGYEDSWERVLMAIDDVSERETARHRLADSETYARGLFEHSPVSLWVEDFSAVKRLLDDIRGLGIRDFRTFTDVHPEFVERCMREIRVIDINQHTIELFGATSKEAVLSGLGEIFRDDMRQHFNDQLIDLWDGRIAHQREVVNYTLGGDVLHVYLQFSVLPGHEKDWSLVLVALTDITARKKAEAYLEYLGKHDVLTKLNNRSFYVDELNRLERKGPFPVTVIVVDLDGLKDVNDRLGHAAGDALLRRTGEVLREAIDKPFYSTRIGGDEFAVLMPGTDEHGGEMMMESIRRLVDVNNQFYSGETLHLSMGAATSRGGERLEATVQKADAVMYQQKRGHYAALSGNGT